jgi:hypothetical protein
MAIKKTVELESGVILENAYIKINEIIGNKEQLIIGLDIFVSQESSLIKPFVIRKHYTFVPSDEETAIRWDKQGYEYLKKIRRICRCSRLLVSQ